MDLDKSYLIPELDKVSPIYDYSDLFEEAQDRIEEQLFLEGQIFKERNFNNEKKTR